MIYLHTDKYLDRLQKEISEQAVINFINDKVPEIEKQAVERYIEEQQKFASIVDDQPKVVWNDEPVFFNFPSEVTVISITRQHYGTEQEHTMVQLLVGGCITENRWGISREAHKELVKEFVYPKPIVSVPEFKKKKK